MQELPELTGTEKQIHWAEAVREHRMTQADYRISNGVDISTKFRELLLKKTDSQWWIVTRNLSFEEVIEDPQEWLRLRVCPDCGREFEVFELNKYYNRKRVYCSWCKHYKVHQEGIRHVKDKAT